MHNTQKKIICIVDHRIFMSEIFFCCWLSEKTTKTNNCGLKFIFISNHMHVAHSHALLYGLQASTRERERFFSTRVLKIIFSSHWTHWMWTYVVIHTFRGEIYMWGLYVVILHVLSSLFIFTQLFYCIICSHFFAAYEIFPSNTISSRVYFAFWRIWV